MVSRVHNADRQAALCWARRTLRGQSALCGALSLAAFGLLPDQAAADPAGTKVISGNVTIHKQGNHTEFRQTTSKAILNHERFDIKANESVHFNQPTARALAVNRVIGKDLPTNIAGQLTATGNVWIINPSGVAISKGANINVNGLIATTADIANQDILSGKTTFSGAPEGSAIVNEGFITGGDGSIVLVAPTVENRGTITTSGSDIALGAGSGFTVDMDGDGLTRFEVTPGKDVNLTTTGTIRAEGGAVYMSAESKDVVRGAIVSVGGKVEATRVEENGGVIYIHSGKGKAEVTGTVDASQTKGRGGKIIATGAFVEIKKTARLDASGATDGGTVHVGGGYRGKKIHSDVLRAAFAPDDAPLPTARIAVVERGAEIRVNAGEHGNGGEAVVWADNATAFYGKIEARGGFLSGDGGLVEVSGKINLAFDGNVDTSAPFGKAGALLLDPELVNIVAGANGSGAEDGELTADNLIDAQDPGGSPAGETFTISTGAIQTALAVGGVTIEATGAIDFQAALDVSTVTGTNGLTLNAGTDIAFDQVVTMGAHPLVATAGGQITVDAALSSTTSVSLTAGTTLAVNETLTTGGGALALTSGGTLTVNDDGTLPPDTLTSRIDTGGGALTLTSTGDRIVILDGVLTSGGDATLTATEIDFGTRDDDRLDAGTGTVTLAKQITADPDDTEPVILSSAAGADQDTAGTTFDFVISQAELDKITAGTLIIDSNGRAMLLESGASALNVGRFDTVRLNSDDANVTIEGVATETVVGGSTTLTTTTFDVVAGTGDLSFETATPTFQNLTVTSANTVSQSNQVIVIGTTSITADGTVTLDNASNDFGGIVNVDTSGGGSADAVVLADTNSITLGAFAASSLSVSATDIETDATFSATAVSFTNAAGDAVGIGTAADADATTFELTDTDMTRMAGATVEVTTSGGADGDVTLDSVTFATDLTINASDDVDFGTSTHNFSSATLTVNAGGSGNAQITQGSGGSITAGTVLFSAETGISQADTTAAIIAPDGTFTVSSGDVSLPGQNNFAATTFNASGVNITVNDINAIGLGDIDATGNLTVTAGGAISDDSAGNAVGADVDVAGTTSLSASGAITLDDTGTDLATVDAAGTDITLADANAIVLGDIDATGNLTVTAASGSITDDNAGNAAGADVNVTGTTSLSASGAVTLDDTGTDLATVHADGTDITLIDANTIVLGDIDASGNLTVTALGTGDITDAGTGGISVTGTSDFTAGDDISVLGTTGTNGFGGVVTLSADQIIDFTSAGGITYGDVTATNLTAQNVLTSTSGAVDFSGTVAIAGTGDLQIRSGGDVTQSAGSITADNLELTAGTTATDFALNQANSVNSLGFADTTAVSNSISVTDTGGIDLTGGTTSALTLTTTGAVTDSGAVTVTGITSISAGTNAVTLDVAANDFADTGSGGRVDIAGGALTLVDTDSIVLGDIDTASTLSVTAGGAVTDDGNGAGAGTDINVTGLTTISTSGTITLNDANNDFSTVSAGGTDVTLRDTNAIVLADIDASGNLTVTADGGSITDDGAGNLAGADVNVTGATSLSASGAITLDDLGTDFDVGGSGDAVAAAGTDITLRDANSIVLGDIDATGGLTVTAAAGSIADDGLGNAQDADVDVTGTTSLSASGAVTLDDTGNDFDDDGSLDAVNVAGSSVALVDRTGIDLGAVSSSTTLSVTAGGPISDSGLLIINGTTTLATEAGTAGTITLDEGTGIFGSTIHLDTDIANNGGEADVLLISANGGGLVIGDVDALNVRISAPSAVTGMNVFGITPGGGVQDIEGTATYEVGGGSIVFTNAANDFSGAVNVDADFDGVGSDAGAVSLVDSNALILGAIDAGSLNVSTGGAITDTAGSAIGVTGATTLTATGFDIVLDNDLGTGGQHDFDSDITGDALTFSGANVTIRDIDKLTLGASTATTSLTVAAVDFDITGVVTVGGGAGTATFLSSRFVLDSFFSESATDGSGNAYAVRFTSADAALISSGNAIFREDSTVAAPTTTVVTSAAQPINVFFFDSGTAIGNVTLETTTAGADINFGSVSFSNIFSTFRGDLTVLSADDVTNTAISAIGNPVSVVGATSISADVVTLDQTGNNFGGTVTLDASAATLVDANSIVLGDVDVTGNLTVSALAGSILDDGVGAAAGDDINVDGVTRLSAAGTIVLDDTFHDFNNGGAGTDPVNAAGSSITLNDINDIVLGDIDATGNLTVTAGGSITDDGDGAAAGDDINVDGATSLSASGVITLDDLFNDFDAVISGDAINATGTNVTINDSSAVVLGNILATNLTLTAGGAVSQAAASGVAVSGNTSISATGFDVTLDNAANNFADNAGAGEVDVTGAAVTLRDSNAINLGTVSATALTLNAVGAVTQTGGGQAIAVTGTSTINAAGSSVTLNETSNDFSIVTGAAGGYVISESNGLTLSGLAATAGDIVVTSGGDVFASTAAGVVASGNVRLESTGSGAVGALSGSQIIASSNGPGAGDATLISDAGVVGGASNTTISGDNVTLTGNSVTTGIVMATVGSVTATADTTSIAFNNTVTAATTVIGNAATDITVSDVTAPNLLLTTTDGDIGQFGSSTVAISGNSTLTAGGTGQNVTLTETTNDFATVSASATGDSISLVDVDDIILDQIDAAGLSVTAGNTITDASGAVIAVSGVTSLTAANTGLTTFFDIALDSATNDFGTTINAIGSNITLTDANAIVLGDIDAAGNLTVAALGGTITDDGASAATGDIDVAGTTSLSASGDIVLDDTFNDFDSDGAAGAPTDEVDAAASNLTLVDIDDVALGDIDVPGNATITATGAIVDDGAGASPDGINIGGTTSLVAGGSVVLDDAANDFATVDALAASMTLTDTNAIVLGDILVTGNMTVAANGNITDVGSGVAGAGVEVLGTTSLSASGAVTLDDVVHDFGTDAGTGDATTEVDATGTSVTLVDIDAIQLGAVSTGALTVTAGGSITDTVGDVIAVTGATSLTAQDTSGTNFFDIRLDGNDGTTADRPHDFNTVTFLSENFWIVDANALTIPTGTATADASADPTIGTSGSVRVNAGELTLTSLTADGDISAQSVGRFRIGSLRSTGGDIVLTTTGDNFSIIPGVARPTSATGSAIPIWANGLLVLNAPSGSFVTDGVASPAVGVQTRDNAIPEDLTFRSDTSLIEFDFNVGFVVIDTLGAPAGVYALTLDAPESAIRVNNGLFAIGSAEFLDDVESGNFNPFQSLAQINDPDLLFVSGALGLVSDGVFEVRLQNTSGISGTQQGTGAIVTGLTYLGGQFDGLTLFGTFNGFSNVSAALKGFSGFASQMPIPNSLGRGYPDLVVDNNNTANGCIIGAVTSCTPLISILPFLSFEDGRFLGIAFVDPSEEEDDPFSNRGDEEEWE